MKNHTLILKILLGLLLSIGLLAGCEDNNPVEEAGDKIEDIGDDAQEAVNDTRRELEDATD